MPYQRWQAEVAGHSTSQTAIAVCNWLEPGDVAKQLNSTYVTDLGTLLLL